MSDKAMKIILSVLTAVLLVLIVCLFAFKGNSSKVDLNKIALRAGEFRQYTSMTRSNSLASMEKAFSRVGYNVVSSTQDNLYPVNAEDAGVNFYVRGYTPYNELKTKDNAVNILYIRDYEVLSQEELANELNVSRQAITKWESGDGSPDIENLKNIITNNIFNVFRSNFTRFCT